MDDLEGDPVGEFFLGAAWTQEAAYAAAERATSDVTALGHLASMLFEGFAKSFLPSGAAP